MINLLYFIKKGVGLEVKKNNLLHYAWLIGVYAILLVILMMVVEYKVKWENKDLSTYLYFYNCSNNLCTTTNPVGNYYSNILCNDNECPYIKEKENNIVILSLKNKDYVYDYINDKILNDTYNSYKFASNSYIVKDNNDKYGIINREGEIIVEPKYNKIIDYKDGIIAYSENSLIGIENKDGNINIKPTYEDVMIISDSYYGYLENGIYYIADYNTEVPLLDEKYDYMYVTNNAILTVKDKKIAILDNNLKSKLLIKPNTFYSYKTERERNSLNVYRENNLLHFSVILDQNKITNYTYDITNSRLYS